MILTESLGKFKRNWNQFILTFVFVHLFLILIGNQPLFAQQNYNLLQSDSTSLEKVIVEKYYVSDSDDYRDTTYNTLPNGAVTYRIFIDMKPGYMLQVVYGNQKHELFIKTSTTFFNNLVDFAETGFNVNTKYLHIGSNALDSWITMGAASRGYTGIPLNEDDSVFSLINNHKALSKVDGLTKGVLPKFQVFNLDLKPFRDDTTANVFSTNNGGWAAMGGVSGPTPENRVLIAQITTTGKLSFRLNVQLGTPTGGTVQFVASDPEAKEIAFKGLAYNEN
ncbi:MAG: hypothetical protein HXX13_11895 [Bacteroidetes bacterium]|nr:hypothetical protein [Bacteroidota bacterium]